MEIDYGDKVNEDINDDYDEEQKEKDQVVSNILESEIPKEDWVREVEKIASKLKKVDHTSGGSYNTTEWRTHTEQIKGYDNVKAITSL